MVAHYELIVTNLLWNHKEKRLGSEYMEVVVSQSLLCGLSRNGNEEPSGRRSREWVQGFRDAR